MEKALEKLVVQETLNLEKIEEALNSFNPLEVMGVVHRELQHSNVLGWLLDPSGSHKMGNYFLKGFITELDMSGAERIELLLSDPNKVEVRREWENIDIVIAGREPSFAIIIENKVWAGRTGADQLLRYRKKAEQLLGDFDRQYFVFLTPFPQSLSADEEQARYINITYETAVGILNSLPFSDLGISKDVTSFIEHYIQTLQNKIIMDSEHIRLARKIYKRHRQALDFIMNNKPVLWSPKLFELVRDYIDAHPKLTLYTRDDPKIIRFLPKAIEQKFHKPFDGWADHNLMFALEVFIEAERIWVKFCFAGIYNEKEKESLQKIKDDYYWKMAEFPSLKNNRVSSGPQYNYPAVARFELFHLSSTLEVDANGFFKDFKEPFEKFVEKELVAFERDVNAQMIN